MRSKKSDLEDNSSVSELINVLNEIDYEDRMSEKRDQMGARRARTGCPQQLSIRHLTKIYSSSRITKDKKTFIEKTIKDSQTRSMAILTILRNRKDW